MFYSKNPRFGGVWFCIGLKLAVPESVAKAGFRGGPFYIDSKMNEECLFLGYLIYHRSKTGRLRSCWFRNV